MNRKDGLEYQKKTANEIFIINNIGESMRREIEYAENNCKGMRYLIKQKSPGEGR